MTAAIVTQSTSPELLKGMTTGHIDGVGEVPFVLPHRTYNDTPVVLTMTVNVPMSAHDIAVFLWHMVDGDDEITYWENNPGYVHSLLLETIVSSGSGEMEDTRIEFEQITDTHSETGRMAARVRALVARLYGPAVTTPAPRRALEVAR